MKKIVTAVCLALAGAFCYGAAVTPRQMTNYVNGVSAGLRQEMTNLYDSAEADLYTVKTNLESKIEEATPEGYQEIAVLARGAVQSSSTDWTQTKSKAEGALQDSTTVQSALSAAATAVQPSALSSAEATLRGELAATTTVLRAEIAAATPDQYSTVKEKALSAIQTLEPATQYVNSVATILNNRISEVSGDAKADLETYFEIDDDGTYIVVQKVVGGVITNMRYGVRATATTAYGNCWGMKIVSSTDPTFPVGEVFARTQFYNPYYSEGGGVYVDNKNSTPNFQRIINVGCRYRTASGTGTSNSWHEYKVDGCQITDDNTMNYLVINGSSTQKEIVCEVNHYNASYELTGTYSITLQPVKLLQENWESASKQTFTSNAGFDYWVSDTTNVETKRMVNFVPMTAGVIPTPTPTLMSLFVPTAYADPIQIFGVSAQYAGDWIDAWTYNYNNYSKTEYTVKPKVVADAAQWANRNYWKVNYPASGVTVQYTDEYGNTVTTIRKIRNEAQAMSLLVQSGWNIPAWTAPQFKKKNNICYAGHIWGANCECTECGEKRSHDFDEATFPCLRCSNYYSTWELDDDDIKVPTGTDYTKQCLKFCDEYIESKHGGWHHEDVGDQNGDYSCGCYCGHYGQKNQLKHSYSSAEEITTWYDAGDGINHYGYVVCERSGCGHQSIVYRNHYITDFSGATIPIDNFNHYAHGLCDQCRAEGWEEFEHTFGDNCYCTSCEDTFHLGGYHICGGQQWGGCERCGHTTEGSHDFSSPKKINEYIHSCECGEDFENHYYVNGVCACGAKSKNTGSEVKSCHAYRAKGGTGGSGGGGSGGSESSDPHYGKGDDSVKVSCPDCNTPITGVWTDVDWGGTSGQDTRTGCNMSAHYYNNLGDYDFQEGKFTSMDAMSVYSSVISWVAGLKSSGYVGTTALGVFRHCWIEADIKPLGDPFFANAFSLTQGVWKVCHPISGTIKKDKQNNLYIYW